MVACSARLKLSTCWQSASNAAQALPRTPTAPLASTPSPLRSATAGPCIPSQGSRSTGRTACATLRGSRARSERSCTRTRSGTSTMCGPRSGTASRRNPRDARPPKRRRWRRPLLARHPHLKVSILRFCPLPLPHRPRFPAHGAPHLRLLATAVRLPQLPGAVAVAEAAASHGIPIGLRPRESARLRLSHGANELRGSFCTSSKVRLRSSESANLG